MLKSYITVAVRNILRHKGYSAINIAGLAVGMTVCILILLWVADEVSYDRFHARADRIYRCYKRSVSGTDVIMNAVMPGTIGPTVKDKVPEVVDCARLLQSDLSLHRGTDVFAVAGHFADPSFLTMFSFSLIEGDPRTMLSTPNSIVLTQKTAAAIFGDEDPIGQVLSSNLIVTGIMANVPRNSTIEFDYLIPMSYAEQEGLARLDDWYDHCFDTFVLLHEDAVAAEVDPKIINTFVDYDAEWNTELRMQPLTDIYLRNLQGGGRITYVYIFWCVAVLILMVACINFMNLTTARSMRRAKEIGLRKTLGAGRPQLILQVQSESLITTVIALCLAVCLAELALPFFNDLSGKQLALELSGRTVLLVAALAVVTGLLSGSYPALFLSSFRPVAVLKKTSSPGRSQGARLLGRAMVVFQFALSVFLVFAATVIRGQLDHVGTMDLGINRDNILCVYTEGLESDHAVLKNELSRHPGVLGVAAAWQPPTRCGWWVGGFPFEGGREDQGIRVAVAWVDFDYVDVFGLEIVEGRPFLQQYADEEQNAYIVNEAAVRAMGMESPIGKQMGSDDEPGHIVGVVRDFHFSSLHNDIEPLVLAMDDSNLRYLCIKIAEDDAGGTLDFLQQKWKQLRPGQEFRYRFFDELLNHEYRAEQQASTIVECFTLLAILIAGMGLFGLAAYSAEQRTKEIGIRKVLGASVAGIVRLLTREFVVLVGIANVIAWPIAYFAMNHWLQDFAYRIELGLGTFVMAGLAAMLIALLTVSYQAIRAARANPVEALKYE